VMEAFAANPPHCVEITLYGATAKTYETITGVPGSFEKCMGGIHRLREAGFNLRLKTMLMSLNQHELADMQAMASDLNASFRYDAAISPRLDGDRSPLQYRVSAATAAEKESMDQKKIMQWRDLYLRFKDVKSSGNLYDCGAGMTAFHVDSRGILRPCFMVPGEKYHLTRSGFHDIWHDSHFLDFQRPGDMPPICEKCHHKVLCGYCPGFFKLETGDERTPSDYLCRIGGHRRNMIFSFNSEETLNGNGIHPSTEKGLSKTGTDGY
jgi:radical SAM protein with 4Fe4S-binding SPASM domain